MLWFVKIRQQDLNTKSEIEPVPPVDNNRNDQPPTINADNQDQNQDRKTERPPIPLNEYGLPPSLIPLSAYNHNQNPYNLQPYPYTNYPLIYDSFGGYQQHNSPLLPPFNFFQPIQPQQPPKKASSSHSQHQQQQSDNDIPPVPQTDNIPPSQLLPATQTQISPIDIINYSNKNKDIPDVPPPPLPTSRKSLSS